jgi:hypothetical protein
MQRRTGAQWCKLPFGLLTHCCCQEGSVETAAGLVALDTFQSFSAACRVGRATVDRVQSKLAES